MRQDGVRPCNRTTGLVKSRSRWRPLVSRRWVLNCSLQRRKSILTNRRHEIVQQFVGVGTSRQPPPHVPVFWQHMAEFVPPRIGCKSDGEVHEHPSVTRMSLYPEVSHSIAETDVASVARTLETQLTQRGSKAITHESLHGRFRGLDAGW